ncbi:MAG TPA: efflux RND transporter periplasmic adaptor subunit [Methylomirabilota bacterium]|nr:efflux RND transporter periplasmic adaptor subunit [Methylomirabilota bacterium]
MKRAVLIVLALVVVAGLATAGYLVTASRAQAAKFRTVKAERGSIVTTVSATGNLNAVTTVQVGSQVSGQIKELYVDFNSAVKKGQLIARLDPDPFQAKMNAARADVENAQAVALNQRANVEKARSEIENARAGVVTAQANAAKAQADVENTRAAIATARANVTRDSATLANAKLQLDRSVDLLKKQLIAQNDKDQAQTSFETAKAQVEATQAQVRASEATLRSAEGQLAAVQSQANAAQAQVVSAQAALQVAEAQLKAAEASVRNKQAALDQARLDLEHSEIRAPVDGVVISRAIDVGQTVAASLQAPTLFTIAQDLTRMQVEAAVDEADVGRLREGMPATFTVDAFPGQTFRGEIVQIRKAPQVVQNVVTYTTVIAVANPERKLMPGMTASVRVQVDRKEDVLRVPNAALRFRPPGETGAGPEPTPGGGRSPAAGGGAGGGPGGGAGGGLGQQREMLTRELGLTSEQQTRLDAILAESRQAFGAMAGQGLDDRAREAQRKRIRAETRDKIRAILRPEQQAKYDALTAAAQEGPAAGAAPAGVPGRVFVVGPDGKPKAVSIVTGASDGSSTEVLRGDLQAGQEVITGQAGTSAARGSSGSAPRLRF